MITTSWAPTPRPCSTLVLSMSCSNVFSFSSDVLEEATEHPYIAEAVEVVDEEEQMMMTIRQPNEGVIVFGAPLGLVLRP